MKNAAALQKNSWGKRKKFNETGQALEEKRIRRRCPAFMKGRKAQSSLEGGYSEKKQYPLDLMKEGASRAGKRISSDIKILSGRRHVSSRETKPTDKGTQTSRQYAPLRPSTTGTVLARIRTSIHIDQLQM